MHREHPLRIIRYSIRNIWLLAFPLMRSIFSMRAAPKGFLHWIQGTWFDLLILLLILGFGWLRWFFRKFTIEKGDLCVHEGIFLRHSRYLPAERLSALTLEYPFWLKPVGGMYLYADTASGVPHASDLRLLIRRRDAEKFRKTLPKMQPVCRHGYRQRVRPWRILLFSVIFSSSFSGALYTAAFWFQGGRISRDLLEEFALPQRLGEISEELARRLYGIPPAAVTIGIIVLSTWLLSFVNNLLRYGSFYMETDRRMLFVSSGILTKRSFFLHTDKINFIDIRQNLLTKLCRMFSLAINCPGYGSRRGAIPVCLPILKKDEIAHTLPLLFPDAAMIPNALRPPLTAFWGYIWAPVLGVGTAIPAAVICRRLFPSANQITGFVLVMVLIPLIWKIIVQIGALCTSGVNITDSQICLRFCRGFVFHTIIAGTGQLASVRIHRNLWQLPFGKCNVVFYFRSEHRQRCVLRNVEYVKAVQMLHSIK